MEPNRRLSGPQITPAPLSMNEALANARRKEGTIALTELAKWHDETAAYLEQVAGTIESDMRVAKRHRASAAACRELQDKRHASEHREADSDLEAATDAAILEIKE